MQTKGFTCAMHAGEVQAGEVFRDSDLRVLELGGLGRGMVG
jgi:hypothetical protein